MKQCEKCGQLIAEGVAFCPNCGAAVPSTVQPPLGPPVGVPMAPTSPTPANQFTRPAAPGTSSAFTPLTPVQSIGSMSAQVSPVKAQQKQSNGKIIAMAVACVVCLAVGVTGIVMALNSNKNSNNNSNSATPISNNTNNESPDGPEVPYTSSSETKVSYAGFEFDIPADYEYEIYANDSLGVECLTITDLPNSYISDICYFNDNTFTAIENNIDTITSGIELDYGKPVIAGSETIDGKIYYYFDLGETQGQNCMVATTEAGLYYFEILIVTRAGVSGTEYLENIAKVVNTAQKKKDFTRAIDGNENLSPAKILPFGSLLSN